MEIHSIHCHCHFDISFVSRKLSLFHESSGPTWVPCLAVGDLFRSFEALITPHSIQYANGECGRFRHSSYSKPFAHESMHRYVPLFLEVAASLPLPHFPSPILLLIILWVNNYAGNRGCIFTSQKSKMTANCFNSPLIAPYLF